MEAFWATVALVVSIDGIGIGIVSVERRWWQGQIMTYTRHAADGHTCLLAPDADVADFLLRLPAMTWKVYIEIVVLSEYIKEGTFILQVELACVIASKATLAACAKSTLLRIGLITLGSY
jgi:hypothetical protein